MLTAVQSTHDAHALLRCGAVVCTTAPSLRGCAAAVAICAYQCRTLSRSSLRTILFPSLPALRGQSVRLVAGRFPVKRDKYHTSNGQIATPPAAARNDAKGGTVAKNDTIPSPARDRLYPQGVGRIRKAAKLPTAALPRRFAPHNEMMEKSLRITSCVSPPSRACWTGGCARCRGRWRARPL